MNYAIISPDHSILAAVGDENRAYFYAISPDWNSLVTTEFGEKLVGWEWDLARCVEMDIGSRTDDACCFTIAFSPSSRLCAIGSQSGIITVLDVVSIQIPADDVEAETPVLCQFPASRSCTEGGAVRCMTFSPEPWDLLVWLEAHGRAGVADVRQAFLRRQVLHLDLDDPQLQEVHTTPFMDDSDEQRLDDDSSEFTPRRGDDDSPPERGLQDTERSSLRESLIHDLTERERLILEFLNTARWTTRLEAQLTEQPERSPRTTLHPHSARSRQHVTADATTRSSRPASPHLYESSSSGRHAPVGRLGVINARERTHHPRRQSSVVLSQGTRPPEAGSSAHDRQPSLTLSYSTSPSELRFTAADAMSRLADPDSTGHDTGTTPGSEEQSSSGPALDFSPLDDPASLVALDFTHPSDALRLRAQRSSSTPRRTERSQTGAERRYDSSRLSHNEIRANVAAERIRRQRQIANEVHNRPLEREQRHRSNILGFEQSHSPRWIRNIINDLPDRSLIHGPGAEEPDATAGVGWGADGRTL